MTNLEKRKIELEAERDLKKSQFLSIRTELLEYILEHYGVSMTDFVNGYKNRQIELSITRHIMMTKANEFGFSLARSGAFYGKDHATVMHSKKVIKNLIATDKHFAGFMERIDKEIERLLKNVKL